MEMLASAARLTYRWFILGPIMIGLGIALGLSLFFTVLRADPKIGIIDVPFTVITENSAFFISQMLDYAREREDIKAVVVLLNSPGGGVTPSEQLFLRTANLREEKPVVISANELLASGGYMMSMGANLIYAKPSSIVGSIGVRTSFFPPPPPNETDIGTGPAKLTGGTERTLLGEIELLKEAFLRTVISQRGDRLKMSPEEILQALTYPGFQAKQLGLIDEIGSDIDAIRAAARLAGIDNYELVDVNAEVIKLQVEEFRRIFGTDAVMSVGDNAEPPVSAAEVLGRIGRLFPPTGDAQIAGGVPSDIPISVSTPRYFYLYGVPTDAAPVE
ncbi:MAG: S49 family peptidase [Chloroflexi bacterium]|nr:S49 family peptidase [Chloroflexota bacterium]MCI0803395.1 S49 family peptidase [Chloroflexota bacterium]MCI0809274.1 S49 family peptidase [Chloroflexota bacterium]MCI0834792.1 S49 family peptidase [Chloroflexota bacterium]MCI0836280.1 S49 family peptidase [Chloroflexota bacterium]